MKLWKEFLETNSIKEEAPVNMAGPMATGDIAGLGTGKNEPGFYPKKKKYPKIGVEELPKTKIDGRRKEYRVHREKLEAAREKRKNRKELQDQKFAEDIKNKNLQMAWPSTASGIIPDTAMGMADLSNKKKSFKKKTT